MLKLNKEIEESLKTNQLVISISDSDWNKLNTIKTQLQQKYQKKLSDLNDSSNFRKAHAVIVKKIIMDILNQYEEVKKYHVCSFLIGSYARVTNKPNSDIDFQMCYEQKYKWDFWKVEEIIYYLIAEIIGIKRMDVHAMMITRLSDENIIEIEEKIDDNSLEIVLKSPIHEIKYTYPSNKKRRFYLEYGNDNSLKELFHYLDKEVEGKNREWAHVFSILTEKELFEKEYQKLLLKEKRILSTERINQRKKDILTEIEEIEKSLETINHHNLKEIKQIYQKKEFDMFYNYLSYQRDIELMGNNKWKYINCLPNQKYLKRNKVYKIFLEYLDLLTISIEEYGRDYSIHQDKIVTVKNQEELRKKLLLINHTIKGELI